MKIHLSGTGYFPCPCPGDIIESVVSRQSRSTEPDGGWQWVTGEPWSYTDWFSGEPDDIAGTEEKSAMFAHVGEPDDPVFWGWLDFRDDQVV